MTSPARKPLSAAAEPGIDRGHDHALEPILDLESLARLGAQGREFHSKRLGDSVRLQRAVVLGGERGLLLSILEPPERDRLRQFLAVADHHDLDLPADWHRRHQTRKVAQFLDLLAVELDDYVARH